MRFRRLPIDAEFRPTASVQVVIRRTGRGGALQHEVLHVGEAARLKEQLASHPKADCFTRYSGDAVGVRGQEDGASSREAAPDLGAELQPFCHD